ncbi:MAG: hypothetical protein JXR65_11595 [Bacteroidales bacterium]|nr:hypothetical protein [Bacteroidales bacterium]
MANKALLISGIEYKVRKLIEQNRLLHKENLNLKQQTELLLSEKEQLQRKLNDKENEIVKQSLAEALESKYGVEKGLKLIDELIKEIDRSIDIISD